MLVNSLGLLSYCLLIGHPLTLHRQGNSNVIVLWMGVMHSNFSQNKLHILWLTLMKLPQLSFTDKCMLNVPLKDGCGFFFILYYIFCMSAEFFFSIFDTVLFSCCNVFCRSKISDLLWVPQ